MTIHCSATPAGGKNDNIGASDIRQWHRAKGWRDIGYHYVIKRDGTVEKGRPDDQPGAHEPRLNARSIAVCLVGGSPPIGSAEYKKGLGRSEEHTPELQSLMRISYAVFCMKQTQATYYYTHTTSTLHEH